MTDSHDTATWFNTSNIDISRNSSYTDKHTKRTIDSINHFVKVSIDITGEDKKFV